MCLEIKKECILLKVFIGAKNNKHKGNSTWRGKKMENDTQDSLSAA